MGSLDLCHFLSSRPARAAPYNPWLSDVLHEHRSKLHCQSITYWMLTNQGSDVNIQMRLRYSVTEALRIAKADSKSLILILLDISDVFWHCKQSDPPVHPLITGHHRDSTRTSSTAQPGKDGASGLPWHFNSTAWLQYPARFFYNYPIKFNQES